MSGCSCRRLRQRQRKHLEGQKRKNLFETYPPKCVYVFSKRKECALNGNFKDKSDSAVAYAWFVWEIGYKGDAIIKWI